MGLLMKSHRRKVVLAQLDYHHLLTQQMGRTGSVVQYLLHEN
jgi:hypothetical protein